ncbi:SusC/RagA family TonB-linked outer membrane protein [Flexithrix dorotheae]|uniref:SusC/RagA family TonB-linked outer membrane protein n=1 Tax=Flexithrix dorotheae TaxID=70993 RepID=UPI0005C718EB|nr:SusC/RagA family TonB-linked outer membrane protein [Flexithrix dorotheae]
MKHNDKIQLIKISVLGFLIQFMIIGGLVAQDITISGKITNATDGEPLPGVSVLLQGTTNGALSDIDGNYKINAPSDGSLLFSFIGYEKQTIEINGRSTIDVILAEDVRQLDEVVVTAFGLEKEKKAITYAAQNVSTEEMTEARPLNVVDGLSGKVSGISVARTGTGVGAQSKVILRGNRSVAGSSQPIYIVDGAIMGSDISNFSPDDIESITVLKGANAAALYGSRANNGAIVVTTKKGAGGKGFNVQLNTTYMAADAILLTNYQNEYGQGSGGVYGKNAVRDWGPRLDGSQVEHWSNDPNFPTSTATYSANPDNIKDFFNTGHNLATNLGISTSSENTNAYFSYTFTDAEGIVKGNELESHNLNVRVNTTLSDKLTLDSRVNYIREVLDNQLATGENFANPIRHAFRIPRNVTTADASIFSFINDDGIERQHFWKPNDNGGANPYWTINRNLNNTLRERVIGLISLKYDITEDLSILGRSAIDRNNYSRSDKLYNDSYVIADFGNYTTTQGYGFEWNSDFLLNYNKEFGTDFSIDASFGGNIRRSESRQVNTNNGQLNVPNLFALSNAKTLTATEPASGNFKKEVQSIYGFATIGWKNAVFLDLTARNDWSSTLPAANRSYFYPSVGLTAVVSDLFAGTPGWLTFLKLRGSYAQVGNDTDPYQTARAANIGPGGNNGYLQLSTTIPIENLLPEETVSTEFGLDARFLNNRLGFDFTWYKSNSQNQLFAVNVPVGSGASSIFLNGADVENKGIEFSINATVVQSNKFSWDLNFNYGANNSTVLKIAEGFDNLNVGGADFMRQFKLVEGRPWGEVYSRGFERDEQGRVLIADDGTPRTTAGLDVPVANFNPDWTGGIRNTFNYANFDLSFLIDIRQGGSVVSLTNAIIYADGLTEETLQGRDGSLVFGENFFAHETAVLEDGSANNIQTGAEEMWSKLGGRNAPVGEAFVKDASNTRLRELVLGYTLPSSALAKTPFSKIRVAFVGRNLFFISNAAGNLDPEIFVGVGNNADGFESFGPPTQREYGFNVRLGF